MPNKNWNKLRPIQIGRYAEYYAKMEFASYGFDIYSSEVDDHGVDFVVKYANEYYGIQVKSLYKGNYIFMQKDKFPLNNKMVLCFLMFKNDCLPEIFLIPAIDWNNPNALLVYRKYEGKKSKPEYGVSISQKTLKLLKGYSFEEMVSKIFTL